MSMADTNDTLVATPENLIQSDVPSKHPGEKEIWFFLHKDPVLLAERQGRWQWYWVVMGCAALGLIFYLLIMSMTWALAKLAHALGHMQHLAEAFKALENDSLYVIGNTYSFAIYIIFGLSLCLPAWLLLFCHRGKNISFFTYNIDFSLTPFFKAGGALFVMFAFVVCYYALFYGENLTVRTNWLSLWPWFIIGMMTFFIQTLGEEIVFRGYLLRSVGAVIPYRIITTSIFMLIFTALHTSNPDVTSDLKFMVIYFLMTETVMYWVLFRTRTVMATWGMHWVNNCFAMFFSVQPGWNNQLSLFTYTDPVLIAGGSHFLNPFMHLQNILGIALFIGLVTWKRSPFYLEQK